MLSPPSERTQSTAAVGVRPVTADLDVVDTDITRRRACDSTRLIIGRLLDSDALPKVSSITTSRARARAHTHTHTHPFNGPSSGTTRVGRYQKGKTNLDFTEARDSEWQWHRLGHTQVCTSLQTDNHASTPPLSFLQAGCPSCRPTYSVKALKEHSFALKINLDRERVDDKTRNLAKIRRKRIV